MPEPRAGEDQSERVAAGVLLGAGLLDAGGELAGQRVAVRGTDGVDGGAELAALGCLDVVMTMVMASLSAAISLGAEGPRAAVQSR